MSFSILNFLFEGSETSPLEEMPIQNYKTVGDFSKGSTFRSKVDRAILTSPKAVEKIHRQWENTPYNFDLYFINDKRARNFVEVGEVDFQKVIREEMKISPEEIPDPDPNAITIIFTNNIATPREMMTGWILAHRVGHALWAGNRRGSTGASKIWEEYTKGLERIFKNILADVYHIPLKTQFGELYLDSLRILKYAAQQLGTMKSAREGKIRNWYEFGYELLAQYMVTGKVKLNPLPTALVTRVKNWGHKDTVAVRDQSSYDDHMESLDMYERDIESMLDDALSSAIGRVFVM